MKKIIGISLLLALILTACGGTQSPAAASVENYLQALVEKDEAVMLSNTCIQNELNALLEYDSFALVQTSLDGVVCEEIGQTDSAAEVSCAGSIQATYSEEQRIFDLSERTYQVIEDGGVWLVCGYTK
jgi:hypothetical protein